MSNLLVDRYFPVSAPAQSQPEAPKTDVANAPKDSINQPLPRLSDSSARLKSMLKNCVQMEGGVLLLQRNSLKQSLQDAGFNPTVRADRKAFTALQDAGKKVAEAMKKLDRFGCQAFMANPPSPSAKAALDKVIDRLMDLENSVDNVADKISDSDPNAGRIHFVLENIRSACASRISETITLTSALQLLGSDPDQLAQTSFCLKASEVQGKSLTQIMGEMALSMHGVESTVQEMTSDAEQLFAHVDQLEKSTESVSLGKFQSEATVLQQKIDVLRAKIGSSSDSPELVSLHKSLGLMQEKVTSLCNAKSSDNMQNMVKAMFTPLPKELMGYINSSAVRVHMTHLSKLMQQLGEAVEKAVAANDDGAGLKKCFEKMDQLRIGYAKIYEDLYNSLDGSNGNEAGYERLREASKMLSGSLLGCKTAVYELEKRLMTEAYQRTHGQNVQLRLDLLGAALSSPHVSVSTLVEAQMRGFPARYTEMVANESILVRSKSLGSGSCNSVLLCSYKAQDGGGLRVFKPETSGARSFPYLTAVGATKVNYAKTQLAELNIASCIAADVIGCGDVLAKSSVGVHNGTFGLFMEAAPGKCADDFMTNGSFKTLRKQLSPEMFSKMLGNLQKELNKLEWADLLSGQQDRHPGNYFIDVNPKTCAVKVTGIDNDVAFPLAVTKPGVMKLPPATVQSCIPRLAQHAPVNRDIEVNLGQLSSDELIRLRDKTGFNQANLPESIDAQVYEKLMAVNVETYKSELLACLHDVQAVDAAVARLVAAQELAKDLHANGMVRTDDTWSDPTTLRSAFVSHANALDDDYSTRFSTNLANGKLLTKGFFVRDIVPFMPKMK